MSDATLYLRCISKQRPIVQTPLSLMDPFAVATRKGRKHLRRRSQLKLRQSVPSRESKSIKSIPRRLRMRTGPMSPVALASLQRIEQLSQSTKLSAPANTTSNSSTSTQPETSIQMKNASITSRTYELPEDHAGLLQLTARPARTPRPLASNRWKSEESSRVRLVARRIQPTYIIEFPEEVEEEGEESGVQVDQKSDEDEEYEWRVMVWERSSSGGENCYVNKLSNDVIALGVFQFLSIDNTLDIISRVSKRFYALSFRSLSQRRSSSSNHLLRKIMAPTVMEECLFHLNVFDITNRQVQLAALDWAHTMGFWNVFEELHRLVKWKDDRFLKYVFSTTPNDKLRSWFHLARMALPYIREASEITTAFKLAAEVATMCKDARVIELLVAQFAWEYLVPHVNRTLLESALAHHCSLTLNAIYECNPLFEPSLEELQSLIEAGKVSLECLATLLDHVSDRNAIRSELLASAMESGRETFVLEILRSVTRDPTTLNSVLKYAMDRMRCNRSNSDLLRVLLFDYGMAFARIWQNGTEFWEGKLSPIYVSVGLRFAKMQIVQEAFLAYCAAGRMFEVMRFLNLFRDWLNPAFNDNAPLRLAVISGQDQIVEVLLALTSVLSPRAIVGALHQILDYGMPSTKTLRCVNKLVESALLLKKRGVEVEFMIRSFCYDVLFRTQEEEFEHLADTLLMDFCGLTLEEFKKENGLGPSETNEEEEVVERDDDDDDEVEFVQDGDAESGWEGGEDVEFVIGEEEDDSSLLMIAEDRIEFVEEDDL